MHVHVCVCVCVCVCRVDLTVLAVVPWRGPTHHGQETGYKDGWHRVKGGTLAKVYPNTRSAISVVQLGLFFFLSLSLFQFSISPLEDEQRASGMASKQHGDRATWETFVFLAVLSFGRGTHIISIPLNECATLIVDGRV